MSPSKPTVSPSISPLGAADRHQVEQALGRVLVGTVAGIDDRAFQMLRQQMRRARRGMADHHDVGPHRLDVLGRVDERLALRQARAARRKVLSVGREPLGGQAEAGPRAGRVLEEQVEDDPALQGGHLLAAARRDLGERLGGIEDRQDLLARQLFQTQQMFPAPAEPCSRRRAGDDAAGHGSVLLCEVFRSAAGGDLDDFLDRIDRMQPHANMFVDDRS